MTGWKPLPIGQTFPREARFDPSFVERAGRQSLSHQWQTVPREDHVLLDITASGPLRVKTTLEDMLPVLSWENSEERAL